MAAPRPESQGECVAMSIRGTLASLGVNLIATAIAWYFGGPNVGVLCFAIGIVLLLIAYFWPKKPELRAPPPPPPVGVHQENKQEFNAQFSPQQNFYFGLRSVTVEPDETAKRIFAFMKSAHPHVAYKADEIAAGLNLTKPHTSETLKRMGIEGGARPVKADEETLWMFNDPEL